MWQAHPCRRCARPALIGKTGYQRIFISCMRPKRRRSKNGTDHKREGYMDEHGASQHRTSSKTWHAKHHQPFRRGLQEDHGGHPCPTEKTCNSKKNIEQIHLVVQEADDMSAF